MDELHKIGRKGKQTRKSIPELKREGRKVVDIYSETHPDYNKWPHNKTRRTGRYLLEKTVIATYPIPGEYFQEVREVIELDTVYLFASHLDALNYFKKKLVKFRCEKLF